MGRRDKLKNYWCGVSFSSFSTFISQDDPRATSVLNCAVSKKISKAKSLRETLSFQPWTRKRSPCEHESMGQLLLLFCFVFLFFPPSLVTVAVAQQNSHLKPQEKTCFSLSRGIRKRVPCGPKSIGKSYCLSLFSLCFGSESPWPCGTLQK